MVFVLVSWFILVASDFTAGTRSRDASPVPSRDLAENRPEYRTRQGAPPKAVILSAAPESQSFSNVTDFKNVRMFVGKSESGYDTNDSSHGSRNNRKRCICYQNKHDRKAVNGTEMVECPCHVPSSQNTRGRDRNILLFDKGEMPHALLMNDLRRLKSRNHTLPGIHTKLMKKHGTFRGKKSSIRLPRSTWHLDSDDTRISRGHNVVEGHPEAEDFDDLDQEASLIRHLSGEPLYLEGLDTSDIHLPFDKKDFRELYLEEVNGHPNPDSEISEKYLNLMMSGAGNRVVDLDGTALQKSFTFLETQPEVKSDRWQHHVQTKRTSISQSDLDSMRKVSGDTCKLKLINHLIAVPGCGPRVVKVTTCHGSCYSSAYTRVWNHQIEHMKSCYCCGNAGVEPRVFRLNCLRKPNGETFLKINNPVKCICRPCDSVPEVKALKPYNYK